ncbi:Zn-dependent alcohol dehydrogenase [Gryllotalpicola reticulitermitis]|uniref:Zn-dependent alcohol dehydrogenase n=1 Tax=Gryllotalpicola reticulitermitis TaxID=1184153 RepID=A0ABV8Q9X5_9MICO
MRAAVVHQINGVFDVEDDVEIGTPQGREVLVEVKASGLCHSDLHLAENDFGIPLPMVLGHEVAGIVTAVGPDVTDFAVGDHVVGSLVQSCGHCAACRAGRTYQCSNPNETLRDPANGSRLTAGGAPVTQGMGLGGFAEQALIHENQLAKVPDALPFPQAALLGCGTVTGAGGAINTAGVRFGDTVAVIGAGGVGLNVISGAKIAGADRIIAVDLQPAKLELAAKFGATDLVNPAETDPVAAVLELTGGGVDHAFEVIGLTSTSEQAIKMARLGGGAYLIGVHKPGATLAVDVLTDLLYGQKKVQGVYMGSTNIKHDIPYYADLYLQGRLNLDDLVSREIGLDQINSAYEELKSGSIARSVITSF